MSISPSTQKSRSSASTSGGNIRQSVSRRVPDARSLGDKIRGSVAARTGSDSSSRSPGGLSQSSRHTTRFAGGDTVSLQESRREGSGSVSEPGWMRNLVRNFDTNQEVSPSSSSKKTGPLSTDIMDRAHSIGDEINATGGYRFDGQNDCYGMVRQIWDPVLKEKGLGPLPINDVGSDDWGRIESWDDLRPGDVLSTAQGHAWGANWHGGLYAGKDENGNHLIYDNSGSQGGARLRVLPSDGYFSHVYRPTHELLGGE